MLLFTAVLIYAERKIWGAIHIRRGPNVVGPWGVLQPFADFLKFIVKEPIIPAGANKGVFVLAPLVSVVLALAAWAVMPVNDGWAIGDINVGILYLFAVSSLGVYGVIMAGWASNSKYAFLSALRAAAQMVYSEVSIGFVIVTVLRALARSISPTSCARRTRGRLRRLVLVAALPMFVIFFVSALAETNRAPFDLVEAESELVAGYQVEYPASQILLHILAELVVIITMPRVDDDPVSRLPAVADFVLRPSPGVPGVIWFVLRFVCVFFIIAMVKAFVPASSLGSSVMRLGLKVFLPISLIMVVASRRSRGMFRQQANGISRREKPGETRWAHGVLKCNRPPTRSSRASFSPHLRSRVALSSSPR